MKLRIGLGTLALLGMAAVNGALPAQTARPLEMKLLVLSADGTEPSFEAIKSLLGHVGVPYEAVVLRSQPLPALTTATATGRYQGILLSTGALSYFDGANWVSALSAANWTAIENYMRDYKVRLASFYTFPEARYGLRYISAVSTSDTAPGQVSVLPAGTSVFPYLRTSPPIKVTWSYTYLSAVAPAAGETTTPVLSMSSQTVGATHKKADGREYLALTMDHSPHLLHSMALHYGVVNWVTRGVFLGYRRATLTPQNDDIFLSSDLFVANNPACQPVGAAADPTYDPATACPTLRMAGPDLQRLADWQDSVRATTQFKLLKVAHAYNGFGTTDDAGFGGKQDSLLNSSKQLKAKFNWLSHTYNHENLDCYLPVPNSGVCVSVSAQQANNEILENRAAAKALGIPDDTRAMVTPGISGLNNPVFMQAFVNAGMKYVVTDMSRPGHSPVIPNTAILNWQQPSVIMIPRRATNIFYNTATPTVGANGSEADEYNFLFGPRGIFRLADGSPFFSTTQTYAQVIDRESDAIVTYMLRGEMYPLMFHQANFYRYNGRNSLFTDLMDAVITKYSRISNLTVSSLKQSTLGDRLKERLDYAAAGVAGVYQPGVGVTLTATKAAVVPATGFCVSSCEAVYNGQRQDRISVGAGRSVFIPYNPYPAGTDFLGEDR